MIIHKAYMEELLILKGFKNISLIPMQVNCLPNKFFGRQVETQLFIKFNPHSFGYENEI
jgi:hypothetical protein